MDRRIAIVLVCAATALAGAATGAYAQMGGLALPEDGGPINGTAQAGSAAVARDAQTAWLNPAAMVRLEKREFMLSLQPLGLGFTFRPTSETTATGTSGGDQGGWIPGGALYYAAPVNEKFAWGLSVTSPSGLVLDPTDDWVGRYYMTNTQFAAINIEPSFAYRVHEHWSLGGGIDFQYAALKQEIAINRPLNAPDGLATVDGDSWQVGGSLSVFWEPCDRGRYGLRYRSPVRHSLEGDMEVVSGRPANTSLTIAQSLTFSAYRQVSELVAIMADVGWQDWSDFDKTVITVDGENDRVIEIPREFKDTWNLALGAHWMVDPSWLIMFGGAYASSAVDDDKRTPDLPVDQQFRTSLGGEYSLDPRWRFGLNLTWLWLGANEIDAQASPLTGRVVGDYDASAMIIGLYASLRL